MKMNVKQVRTNATLIPLKRMSSMASTEFDGRDASPQKAGKMDRWMMPTDPKGIKVLIVSCNPFVTDFLRGLVKAHGYDTAVVSDFSEALVQVQNGWPHVVFIDDSCLEAANSKNFQLRTQNLIQEGVPIILLADEQTKQDVERLPTMKFFRIVRKPVGYQQIGQVMADLMIVWDGKRWPHSC
jgi:CheY-like chemotaxis protein